MKTFGIFTLSLTLFVLGAAAQTASTSQTTPGQTGQAASAPAIISRAANCNVWQYQTYETLPNGQVMTHPHTYMEMAGGLNQFDSTTGQWVPAQELIQPYAQGAIAQGQATVIYANNLNSASGVIDEQTPDGQRLTSAINGLIYLDPATGQSVQIAEVQDSYGQLIAANQVLYPNAFNGNGVKASVRFEYRRDGTEQDIILESQLPAPETFGLSSDTAELVVVTEFLNPPEATVSKTGSQTAGLEPDEAISWGATSLGRGKAFSLAGQDVPVVVSKEYRNIDGRYFLFEKVRYKDIRASLSSLPLQSSNARSLPGMASKHLHLPKAPAGKRVDHPMRLALGHRPDKGYVFDYITLSTSFTNYNFQGDTSYFISGNVNLAGSNTFEGGAVVKYAANASITIEPGGSVKFLSRPYRPVVFSCKDDNTVGQTISGSTGSPSGYYANPALNLGSLGSLALSEFRICYANRGLSASGASPAIYDAQFVNCATAISDIIGLPSLENVLFSNTKTNFNSSNQIFPQSIYVQNGTFNNGFDLINSSISGTSLYLTNCIFVNQTNLSGTIAAGYNGFYQSPTVGSPYVTSSTYPLQRAGAASCYLANGCAFLANGTKNVDPYGLSLIALKTVYPPLIYSNVSFSTAANFGPQVPRDNNAAPALGYHYDPLDYVFSGVSVYANMTFSAGTAVGWFELPNSGGAGYGLAPYDKVVLSFNGTASQPCTIARYCTVQEGGNGLWKNLGYMGAIVAQSLSGGYSMNPANAALTRTTFTRHALLAEGPNHYRENNALSQVAAQNSEFWGGDVGAYWDYLEATNCLFDRVAMGVGGSNPALWWMRNCTMHGGGLYLSEYGQTWPVWIEDCAFDGTTLQVDNNSGGNTNETYCGFNAFLANNTVLSAPGTHNVIVANFNWQSGPLGNYYLPLNSPLVDAGSATADHMGLAEFTTQISENKEGISRLDIGYHYVAVDANGNPLDTFVPGTPDYLADVNGNGLPDTWELQWFGNLSHFGSDSDILGNTLLYDYQNGLDPIDHFFDFMNVTACEPLPNLSYGFLPNQQPQLILNTGGLPGSDEFYSWSVAYDSDPHLTGKIFYRIVTTTENYVAGQIVTQTEIKPYYFNAATPDDPAKTPTTDFSQDLRITGFPLGPETITITLVNNPPPPDPIEGVWPTGSSPVNDVYNQETCPPPSFSSGNDGSVSCTQHFRAEHPQPGEYFPTWAPVNTITTLSAPMTPQEVLASANNLLGSIPLAPGTSVGTREGSVNFSYFGETATQGSGNLIPAGAAYDVNGNYTLSGLSPNCLYGYMCDQNEAQRPLGTVMNGADLTTGGVYPVMWANDTTPAGIGYPNPSGQTFTEQISATAFNSVSYAPYSGAVPNSGTFVTRTGSVTFSGGHSGYPSWQPSTVYENQACVTDSNGRTEVCVAAGLSGTLQPTWPTSFNADTSDGTVTWQLVSTPVTAQVTSSHVNRLLVFPTKTGTIITCAGAPATYPAYQAPPIPATDGPTSDNSFGNTCQGIVVANSRFYIPDSPASSDPTGFGSLRSCCANSFKAPMYNQTWLPFANNLQSSLFRAYLSPGEYQFGPENIYGWGSIVWYPGGLSLPYIDLDVDSDNNGTIDDSQAEESIQDQPPGKCLLVNDGYTAGNGIPDFADGYNLYGTPPGPNGTPSGCCESSPFTPMLLEVGADATQAKVKITYSASDPSLVTKTANGDGTYTYTPASGGLRIWAKDGDQFRNMATIDQGGDYVAPKPYSATDVPSLLYIEGITPGTYTINAELDPDGQSGYTMSDEVVVTVVDLQLAVDANRDGNITFDYADQTTAGQPYQFWVNDNHDGYANSFSGINSTQSVQEDLDPSTGNDATSNSISCTRDLEDYTRLWLNVNGIADQLQNGNFLLALKWQNVSSGNPAIRIFAAAENDGGTGYLTDTNVAQSQITFPYCTNITDQSGQQTVSSQAPFFFTPAFCSSLATSPYIHLLFDAVSAGSGQLVLVIYKSDGVTEVVESQPLYLNLTEIGDMYETWTVDNNGVPATTASLLSTFQYTSASPEDPEYILFVHGWNMSPDERTAFANTAYKRLWWQGYKGRFGAFQWPTLYDFPSWSDQGLNLRNYDDSESNSWASATGLAGLLNNLNSEYPGNVYVFAHSMGNVVTGEALKLAGSPVVNTYIACQAAVSSHSYDPTAITWEAASAGSTPDIYANYPDAGSPCYFNGVTSAVTRANFYNQGDWALGLWQFNQTSKPDRAFAPAYHYTSDVNSHPCGFYRVSGSVDTDLCFPGNNYEILAYCVQSCSYALGATPGVKGFAQQNLPTLWQYDPFETAANLKFSDHPWHSAEFLFSSAEQWNFWNALLGQQGFDLK